MWMPRVDPQRGKRLLTGRPLERVYLYAPPTLHTNVIFFSFELFFHSFSQNRVFSASLVHALGSSKFLAQHPKFLVQHPKSLSCFNRLVYLRPSNKQWETASPAPRAPREERRSPPSSATRTLKSTPLASKRIQLCTWISSLAKAVSRWCTSVSRLFFFHF